MAKKEQKVEKKKTADVESPKITEEGRIRRFLQEYRELCQEHGRQIVSVPSFRLRDDGTYSIIVNQQVGKLE